MSNSTVAEVYFIVSMMVLILIICIAATFFFVRQYIRERRNKGDREKAGKTQISGRK